MAKNAEIESPSINLLGTGTVVKGNITSTGDFRIDGTLIGSIQSKGKVVVGPTGIVEGEISCQNADISGNIKAHVTVSELLTLKSTSRLVGDIKTSKLAIEPGALFSGSCKMEANGLKESVTTVFNEPAKVKETATS
ncbi:MAG: polymer-forming cytoskeletal protein [Bacteroidetes bacterium]|nr:polymer-forming cytoskeletal protein [Bacteroidota bacterium]